MIKLKTYTYVLNTNIEPWEITEPQTENANSFISSLKLELTKQADLNKSNQILVKSIYKGKIL